MPAEPKQPIGAEIAGQGRAYFDDVVVDNVLDAMLELTAALWTCQDRQYVLERVLEQVLAGPQGAPDIRNLIETWQPTSEDQQRRQAAREELIANVYRSFARRPAPARIPGETAR